MNAYYDPLLVGLSLLVAAVASYTALDVAGHVMQVADTRRRRLWLGGGALIQGAGIWSMHFVGMLAFSLPIPLGYAYGQTSISLLLAILTAGTAFGLATRRGARRRDLWLAGTVLGIGIAAMHYFGMAAMNMTPGIDYAGLPVALSFMVAIAGSIVGLRLGLARSHGAAPSPASRLAATTIIAATIGGMHYLGMGAASFTADSVCGAADGLRGPALGLATAAVTVAILLVVLLVAKLDRHFELRTRHLSNSLAAANRERAWLESFDPLTGLPNRTTLFAAMEAAIASARREHTLFAVLYIDVDNFKTINDSLGHAIGDKVLVAFVRELRACLKAEDTVARIGGDEFVVLIEGLREVREAENVANHALMRLQNELMIESAPLRVTPSIGIAYYPGDGKTVEELLTHADIAMYSAKQSGRNSLSVYEPKMIESAKRILELQRGLQDALHHGGQFWLAFQPKYDAVSRALSGAEALLRWDHPTLGRVEPSEFIPIAERFGLIVKIGDWVVAEACRLIMLWDKAGMPPVKIALNLSQWQLRREGYAANVHEYLRRMKVEPSRLMFEITETSAMIDAEFTTKAVREFQEHGFEIAIDDFGTGYSSLAYLQQFRVQQLKIDRFFTNGLDTHGEEGYALVSAIIALAHSLKMNVVAEGVESDSQLNKLEALACDQVQGFFLARPLPEVEFARLLGGRGDQRNVAEPARAHMS